jgi:3-deoxy-7-phosphoheptulonate synthase
VSVEAACQELAKNGLAQRLMIDASHANSQKKHENQLAVAEAIGQQLEAGETRIVGVMVESHLVAGRQDLVPGTPLTYGQSITDACLGWDDSVKLLDRLAAGVRGRRLKVANYPGK